MIFRAVMGFLHRIKSHGAEIPCDLIMVMSLVLHVPERDDCQGDTEEDGDVGTESDAPHVHRKWPGERHGAGSHVAQKVGDCPGREAESDPRMTSIEYGDRGDDKDREDGMRAIAGGTIDGVRDADNGRELPDVREDATDQNRPDWQPDVRGAESDRDDERGQEVRRDIIGGVLRQFFISAPPQFEDDDAPDTHGNDDEASIAGAVASTHPLPRTLAGMPTTVCPFSMLFMTTDPAPMVAHSPIVQPGMTPTPRPTNTPSPRTTFPARCAPGPMWEKSATLES